MNEQLRLAQLFWDQLLKTRNYSHSLTSDICTVLISSSRGVHPLLHYTLSSLVKAMTSEDKLTTKILVYNTARPLRNISSHSIIILLTFWLLWFGFVLIILISTNRQNFQFLVGPRAGVHPIESSVPGVLAQLYPRWIISTLEQFLRKRLKQGLLLNMPIPIDLLLIEFLEQQHTNFQQCHLVPDLVDHIGVYSSSIKKNQGSFLSMKQSGTFRWNEAAIDLNLV
ncbi:unnamed protein product [Rotaria sp. Silwood2]|nr:unnamed protein product [Rotaria sp. Silwood2]